MFLWIKDDVICNYGNGSCCYGWRSMMQSLLDQVNILIKMKVGDPYRLQHIKLMLKQKRTVYGSDKAYLDRLIHEYVEQIKTQNRLEKIRGKNSSEEDVKEIKFDDEFDDDEDELVELDHIYCWKCGKSIPVNSKFCLDCGSDIKKPEVKEDEFVEKITSKITEETIEKKPITQNKKNIFIVVGVLTILAVIGGAVIMGGGFEKTVSSTVDDKQLTKEITSIVTSDSNSRCGSGTVFDDVTNTCILEVIQTNSRCGAGTVFDDVTNTCILEGN